MDIRPQLISALGRALEGQRVCWISNSHADSAREFNRIAPLAPDSCTIRRLNGAQSISLPTGGTLRFLSLRGRGIRGSILDRIYVPEDITETALCDLIPAVATSPDGEIIPYPLG